MKTNEKKVKHRPSRKIMMMTTLEAEAEAEDVVAEEEEVVEEAEQAVDVAEVSKAASRNSSQQPWE
jgi:hypothetical protein